MMERKVLTQVRLPNRSAFYLDDQLIGCIGITQPQDFCTLACWLGIDYRVLGFHAQYDDEELPPESTLRAMRHKLSNLDSAKRKQRIARLREELRNLEALDAESAVGD